MYRVVRQWWIIWKSLETSWNRSRLFPAGFRIFLLIKCFWKNKKIRKPAGNLCGRFPAVSAGFRIIHHWRTTRYMLIHRLTSSSIDHWSVSIVRWPRLHHFPIFFVSFEISSSTNLSLKNFYFWTTNKTKKGNPPKMHKRAWGYAGFSNNNLFCHFSREKVVRWQQNLICNPHHVQHGLRIPNDRFIFKYPKYFGRLGR